MKIPKFLFEIKKILPENSYLVGGFLRDYFLGKESFDVDIIVKDNERKISEKIAKKLNSPFFPLDEERGILRIVYKNYFIDVCRIYKNLEEDLRRRDFTINAFSLNFKNLSKEIKKEKIIDNFNGFEDLKKRRIRIIEEKNISDDPLRILRAFRISSQLDFKIEEETLSILLKYKKLLKDVAGERIREELWKIFENENSHIYIKKLFKKKILEEIFPEFSLFYDDPSHYFHEEGLWGHSYHSLKSLEEILKNIDKFFPRVKRKLKEYLNSNIDGRTKRKTILKLGVLLHDIGKPLTAKRINGRLRFFGHEIAGLKEAKKILFRLKASKKELNSVKAIISGHMRVSNLFENKKITEKAIFRFFRDTKEDSVNVLLASFADRLSYRVVKEQKEVLERHYKKTKKFINRFFLSKEKTNPEPLLNGYEIMEILNLKPSKKVGELKNKIIELQALGKLKTKEEAIEFLKKNV